MLKKVYVELTNNCNLECKICYRHQWTDSPADMPEDIWKQLIGQVKSIHSVETIVLGGMGEPLMSPFFAETVTALRDKEMWITTNAMMFREKLIPELLAMIDLFIVSIDGMESRMISDRGVEFSQIIDSIDFLNDLKKNYGLQKPALDVQFVATRQNIDDIFPLMDVLAEKDVRYLVISHLMPQDLQQSEDILYQRYDNQETKKLFHAIRNYSFKKGLRVIFPETELKTERRCDFISNNATYITSGGLVVPCYRLSHQGREVVFGRSKTLRRFSFGQIMEHHLEEIWNSQEYSRFRQKIFNNHYPSCPDCDLVEGCSLINDVDFDCHGDEPNCADCLWSRKFVFCR
jgi:tungsten cofactor oxidoreducase radical SAM maturase